MSLHIAREKFVQMVSQGPGKIPFGFAIQAFDEALKIVPDCELTGPTTLPALPALATVETVNPYKEAETLVSTIHAQASQQVSGMVAEEIQENADALARLHAAKVAATVFEQQISVPAEVEITSLIKPGTKEKPDVTETKEEFYD